jgi:hypothetical protein
MKKLVLVCAVIIICSCKNSTNTNDENSENQLPDIDRMEWLLGSWKSITDEDQLFEIWTKENDTVYNGKSIMIVGNDTVFTETISLQRIGNDLFYFPTVRDHNNGRAITFKLISAKDDIFVFENKEHDFPQRIIYRNPYPDSLYARIEGEEKGVFRHQEFNLVRDNNLE